MVKRGNRKGIERSEAQRMAAARNSRLAKMRVRNAKGQFAMHLKSDEKDNSGAIGLVILILFILGLAYATGMMGL